VRLFRKKTRIEEAAPTEAAAPEALEVTSPPRADEQTDKTKPRRRRGSRGGRGRGKKKVEAAGSGAKTESKADAKAEPKAAPKPRQPRQRKKDGEEAKPRRKRTQTPRRSSLPKVKKEIFVSVEVTEQRVAVLEDDVVVTPYACLLALPFALPAVMANLDRLDELGLMGRYGLYEAVDFTASRLDAGTKHAIVRSFMAHHQGMILVAINNLLHGDSMVRRFHADASVRTTEALLFERPASEAPRKRRRFLLELPRRAPAPRAPLEPWPAHPAAGFPQAHVLSNGRYRALVSDGGGASDWGTAALTRGQVDATLDGPGFRLHVRDLDRGLSWSPAPGDGEMVFHSHMVETRRRLADLSLREQVCVAPGDDVEVRLVTLRNETASRRRLEITGYAEVVGGDAVEDRRHPAFSKLFVKSEYLEELDALVFHRRARAAGAPDIWLAHLLVVPAGRGRVIGHESARERFVGRGRTARRPAAADGEAPARAGMTGAAFSFFGGR